MTHTHTPEAEGSATRTPQSQKQQLPVLILGAGIAGLVLAQALRRAGVACRVFERDMDLEARGVGWGLTLHWSLPILRRLLPAEVLKMLPDAYVDRRMSQRPLLWPAVFVQAVFFVIKFVIYDRWVFAGKSRFRAALRSRRQVWSAARANRTP